MNVHLIYLTVIFVLYILAGDLIATFFWSTNELSKTGTIKGTTLTSLPGSNAHARVMRIVWPFVAFMGMFFPSDKK